MQIRAVGSRSVEVFRDSTMMKIDQVVVEEETSKQIDQFIIPACLSNSFKAP